MKETEDCFDTTFFNLVETNDIVSMFPNSYDKLV